MRATRHPYVWALWLSIASLMLWWAIAPAGYLAYSKQWLLHLRFAEIWVNDQHSVADQLVVPELSGWASQLGGALPMRNTLSFHPGGTPIPSPAWTAIEDRYRARGVEIVEQPTFLSPGSGDPVAGLVAVLGSNPGALETLYSDIERRLEACTLPVCAQLPRVAWVYVVLDSGLSIYWPGGNQVQRFEAGHSPSVEYSGRGRQWLDDVIATQPLFEPLSSDDLGFGDTMTVMHPVTVDGTKGIVGADVYWEKGPMRTIQWQVLAYSGWAVLSGLAAAIALIGIAAVRIAMLREGNGVCVTIDIVGWSQIEDVKERFKRQWALDTVVVRAFLANTKQRLIRWSTGDGYHVLFLDHWGARMYREVLPFTRDLLARWDARVKPDPAAKGVTLRISIGSHGSVRLRRRHGEWIAVGDRIVSAVRIDEVSKPIRDAGRNRWTVAVEQSFRNELRLAIGAAYDAAVAAEHGPLAETDKSGKAHQFCLLDLIPPSAGARGSHKPALWDALRALARSCIPGLRQRPGQAPADRPPESTISEADPT